MGYLQKGGEHFYSLVMYGFCGKKTLYSASLSLTVFIGAAAVARRVLQNRVCPSFPLSGCFFGIGSIVFFKFWHGARNSNDAVRDRTIFFQKNFFGPKHWENGSKFGQK